MDRRKIISESTYLGGDSKSNDSGSVLLLGSSEHQKFNALIKILALFIMAIIGTGAVATATSAPKAGAAGLGIFCSTKMGAGMDSQGDWTGALSSPTAMNSNGRQWNLQEIVGQNLYFTNYAGEGEGTDWTTSTDTNRVTDTGNLGEQKDKLEGLRNTGTCAVGNSFVAISNVGLAINTMASSILSNFVTYAFDPNLICGPDSDGEGCFDLAKMTGGEGNNDSGGLIGILTSSVFFPLIVLVVPVSATIVVVGAVRGGGNNFRGALVSLGKIALAATVAVIILANPSMLSRAPLVVTNAFATCIVGALNGDSCTSNGPSITDSSNSDNVCATEAAGISQEEKINLVMSGLSCSIWKSFVLEPYSIASLGRPFSELNVDNEKTAEIISKAGLTKESFCFGTTSSQTGSSMKNGTLVLDSAGPQICNVAAYQLFLKTNAESTQSKKELTGEGTDQFDKRWLNLVAFSANDDKAWNSWAWNGESFFTKLSMVLMSSVALMFGGVIMGVTAFFALLFRVAAMLIIVMAPIFLLLWLLPKSGNSLFRGWLGQLLSYMWKYLISIAILLIAVIIYGSLLSSGDSFGLTMVLIILLSGAIWYFRDELLRSLGAINFGGTEMTGFVNRLDGMRKKSLDFGKKGTSGFIGGAISSGGNPKSAAVGGFQGAKESMGRSLRRSGGLIGGAAQTAERLSNDRLNDMRQESRVQHNRADGLRNQLAGTSPDVERMESQLENQQAEIASGSIRQGDLQAAQAVKAQIEHKLVSEMKNNPSGNSGVIADLAESASQRDELDAQALAAEKSGNSGLAGSLRNESAEITAAMDRKAQLIGENSSADALASYNAKLHDEMEAAGVLFDKESRAEMLILGSSLARAESSFRERMSAFEGLVTERAGLQKQAAELDAMSTKLNETTIAATPGAIMTERKKAKIEESLGEKAKTDGDRAYDREMDRVNQFKSSATLAQPAESLDEADKTVPLRPLPDLPPMANNGNQDRISTLSSLDNGKEEVDNGKEEVDKLPEVGNRDVSPSDKLDTPVFPPVDSSSSSENKPESDTYSGLVDHKGNPISSKPSSEDKMGNKVGLVGANGQPVRSDKTEGNIPDPKTDKIDRVGQANKKAERISGKYEGKGSDKPEKPESKYQAEKKEESKIQPKPEDITPEGVNPYTNVEVPGMPPPEERTPESQGNSPEAQRRAHEAIRQPQSVEPNDSASPKPSRRESGAGTIPNVGDSPLSPKPSGRFSTVNSDRPNFGEQESTSESRIGELNNQQRRERYGLNEELNNEGKPNGWDSI